MAQPNALNDDVLPSVGVVYNTEVNSHFITVDTHYECPERILRTWELLTEADLVPKLRKIPIRPAHKEEILLVHGEDHWEATQSIKEADIEGTADYYNRLSLYINHDTPDAALLSCGGAIEACKAVATGTVKRAIAVIRPPGHHAEPDQSMGFCFFNNVAVATRVVQQQTDVKRILILDWDVHHGNGTQKAFEDDPSVLYISIHRFGDEFYPGTPYGGMRSTGEGEGKFYSVNIPWPGGGMGDAEYLHAFQNIVMPIAMEFSPHMVIISAGFDAAVNDPLGGCNVTPTGYAHMTHMLAGLAGGRLVVVLEGGYNVDSIAKSMVAVTRVVLGEAPPELEPMVANEEATETVWLVAKWQSKFWKSVKPQEVIPREDFDPESTVTITDILKQYRYNYLCTQGMLLVPLLDDKMESRYGTQVMCSKNLLVQKTVIFFMHEFGNIQSELQSALTCDLNIERTYLIESSRAIINWAKEEGYGLLDVNLFPKFVSGIKPSKLTKDILVYLYDNYIQLSDVENLILIGHGGACQAILGLILERWPVMEGTLRGVVNVSWLNIPTMSADASDEQLKWYKQHSLVAVPSSHPLVLSGKALKKKKFGKILPVDHTESRSAKLMETAMPNIKDFIADMLDKKIS
ncbi:histone deacetylase clr3 [Cylindrobasidium torrendii FP15055 ss-10]|uniref:histone deacetylase n=1 Tax=Cylindrobasidium torrendii FP15055 ss-10 TaxID=1314674 RepID=A0A0D7BKW9_9AGAR|nr:histone deacetylase clr3 [Cylindrobasidium torrendii FP15055 ss-10]